MVHHVISAHADKPIQLRRTNPSTTSTSSAPFGAKMTISNSAGVVPANSAALLTAVDNATIPRLSKDVAQPDGSVGGAAETAACLWGCFYCAKQSHDRLEVVAHLKLEHPNEKLVVTRRKITHNNIPLSSSSVSDLLSDATMDSSELSSTSASNLLGTSEKSRRKQVLPRRIADELSKGDINGEDTEQIDTPPPFLLDDQTGEIVAEDGTGRTVDGVEKMTVCGSENVGSDSGAAIKADAQMRNVTDSVTKVRSGSRKRVAPKSRDVVELRKDFVYDDVVDTVHPPRKMTKRQKEASATSRDRASTGEMTVSSETLDVPCHERRSLRKDVSPVSAPILNELPISDISGLNNGPPRNATLLHSDVMSRAGEIVKDKASKGAREKMEGKNKTSRSKKNVNSNSFIGDTTNVQSPNVTAKTRRRKASAATEETTERRLSTRRDSRRTQTESREVVAAQGEPFHNCEIIYRAASTSLADTCKRRPWSCPYCPFKCGESADVMTHVSVHHEMRPLRVIFIRSVHSRPSSLVSDARLSVAVEGCFDGDVTTAKKKLNGEY